MRAARLNKRIIIEQSSTTRDGYGEPIKTWVTYAEPWAAVEHGNGKEGQTADQKQGEEITRFRIRYMAGITNKMRVNYAGKLYDITAAPNTNERDREIIITGVYRD